MMTREEFEKVVRAMKAEGVSLTMPNLMVRTELPRATIEAWLKDMDAPPARRRDTPAPKADRADARAPRARRDDDEDDDDDDVVGGIMDKVAEIKGEIVKGAATAVVKEKLGIEDDEMEVHGARRSPPKDIRWGAGLGLLGPLGLFYSAPMPVAAATSAAWVALLLLTQIPLVGVVLTPFLMTILGFVHIGTAAAGAAYTWRYNRSGKRTSLLPSGSRGRGRKR